MFDCTSRDNEFESQAVPMSFLDVEKFVKRRLFELDNSSSVELLL